MAMSERFSLDTNVFVYSVVQSETIKHLQAREIIGRARSLDCVLAVQTLGEFYRVAMRKALLTRERAIAQVEDWMEMFPVRAHSVAGLRFAMAATVERRASLWDALMVATAAEGGCSAILTEDMADGTLLGGVRIVNPFGPAGLTHEALRVLAPA